MCHKTYCHGLGMLYALRFMLVPRAGELAAELGLVLDATPKLGNKRNVRFALVAEDGVVKVLKVEEGGKRACRLYDRNLHTCIYAYMHARTEAERSMACLTVSVETDTSSHHRVQ